jgi:hypothetical protein
MLQLQRAYIPFFQGSNPAGRDVILRRRRQCIRFRKILFSVIGLWRNIDARLRYRWGLRSFLAPGVVAEWLNAAVLKTAERETVP